MRHALLQENLMMNIKVRWYASLIALSLMAAGVWADPSSEGAVSGDMRPGFTCPLTGEELPCPGCCPAKS